MFNIIKYCKMGNTETVTKRDIEDFTIAELVRRMNLMNGSTIVIDKKAVNALFEMLNDVDWKCKECNGLQIEQEIPTCTHCLVGDTCKHCLVVCSLDKRHKVHDKCSIICVICKNRVCAGCCRSSDAKICISCSKIFNKCYKCKKGFVNEKSISQCERCNKKFCDDCTSSYISPGGPLKLYCVDCGTSSGFYKHEKN